MKKAWLLSLSLLIFCVTLLFPAMAQEPVVTPLSPSESGIRSLISLALLTGSPSGQATITKAWASENRGSDTVTLDSVRRCAVQSQMPVKVAHLSLSQIRERGGIALLSLSEPQDFALLLASDTSEALIISGGKETFVTQAQLQKRYGGDCLMLPASGDSTTDNPLVIEKPLQSVKATGTDGVIQATFVLRNRGTESLTVRVASETCSCYGAQPVLSSPVIAPQGTTTLSLPVRSRSNATESATVVLASSAIAFPEAVVNVRAVPVITVSSTPKQVAVQTTEGKSWTGELAVQLPTGATVRRFFARNDFVRLKPIEKSDAAQSGVSRFTLTCPPTTPPGEIADEIVFELAGAEVPRFIVPVSGRVTPDVSASPAQLFLGEVATGSDLRRTITFTSASGKPFPIWSAVSSDPSVIVTPFSRKQAAKQEIAVIVRASGTGTATHTITFRVGHWREIVVPVTYEAK